MIKWLFVILPIFFLVGLISLTVFGVISYIEVVGPVYEDSESFPFKYLPARGNIFLPHLIRKNEKPIFIELEIEDPTRKLGDEHQYHVEATDSCNYIDIEKSYQIVSFQDHAPKKQTLKFPILIRNTRPPLSCTISVNVSDGGGNLDTYEKSLSVDAWTARFLSVISISIGLLGTILDLGVLRFVASLLLG